MLKGLEKRIMALAVILFSFIDQTTYSQCFEGFETNGSETIKGLVSISNNRYRNLIIQDLALANQLSPDQVAVRFDYKLQFRVDQCDRDQASFMVLPVGVHCYPLEYRGFDISGSVRPETADLVFHVVNEMGILVDSVLFMNIPIESDSSLYTLRQLEKDPKDGKLDFRFSHALFHYTRKSYDDFRDRLLEIDWYYAAAELADSVIKWTKSGFLKETDSLPEFFLVNFEIQRILEYISRNNNLPKIGFPGNDPAGLVMRIWDLNRLNIRNQTILSQNIRSHGFRFNRLDIESMVNFFIMWRDFYHHMTFTEDFRNAALLEELASPDISHSFLLKTAKSFTSDYGCPPVVPVRIAEILAERLASKGFEYERLGNQIRALEYYESALKMAINGRKYKETDSLLSRICRMRHEIVSSYLGISEKACLAGNPAMAATYYKEAVKLIAKDGDVPCGNYSLEDFEQWLYGYFLRKSQDYIAGNEYRKALPYLEEIQMACESNASFTCPPELPDLFKKARKSVYLDVLRQVNSLIDLEEYNEAEGLLVQAVNLRIASAYAIPRDPLEARIEGFLRQHQYEDYLEEGLRHFYWKEYDMALYYFNKALILENGNLPRPDPRLNSLRQDAAGQVIKKLMSDTRARALMFDFEGYQAYLERVSDMVNEYGFVAGSDIVREYEALQADASMSLCKKITSDYQLMMDQVYAAKKEGNYILAWKLARETVEFSLEHLECGIRDSDAWYQKVVLEPLAAYQEKYLLMGQYEVMTSKEYVEAYQDLSRYYYRNNLLSLGVAMESFHEMVMKSQDPVFLKGMLQYYLRQNSLDRAMDVLNKLHTLEVGAELLADEQKSLAMLLAKRDAIRQNPEDPWDLLHIYVGNDKWYRDFRWSYKWNWILETGGNPRYYPFIWKK